MKRNIKLAVYGTLKRGHGNWSYFLKDANYLGKVKTDKNYSLVVAGLPYMIERAGTGVKGELFEINEQELAAIDRLEGNPTFYERKSITVTDEAGNKIEVYAYVHPDTFPDTVELREEY